MIDLWVGGVKRVEIEVTGKKKASDSDDNKQSNHSSVQQSKKQSAGIDQEKTEAWSSLGTFVIGFWHLHLDENCF